MTMSEAGSGPADDTATGDGATGDGAPRRRGRLGYIMIALIAGTAAVGWAFVMGTMTGSPGITAQTIAYRMVDGSALEITYSVDKPRDQQVRCRVRAINAHYAEIGAREVTVPAGVKRVQRTERLPVTDRVAAAGIRDCRPA